MKKERPILCSTPMVIAINDDLKDVTRRPQGLDAVNALTREVSLFGYYVNKKDQLVAQFKDRDQLIECPFPYGVPGDVLWIRETWRPENVMSHGEWQRGVRFIADNIWMQTDCEVVRKFWEKHGERLQPSIFLPKDAARIKLEIVSVS